MSAVIQEHDVTVLLGDVREQLATLPGCSVNCIVTSPPYFGLRDYGMDGQIGLEASPAKYVAAIVSVFRDAHRVLADNGVLWLNLGDSYSRAGQLWMIPSRVALALQEDGWLLRSSVIWHKLTAMPESVTDRLSKRHENLYLLAKSPGYFFDLDAIREPVVTTRESALSWDRPEQRVPGQRPQHRPQRARAEQIAAAKGLTTAHLEAVRSVGMSDAGKAVSTQSGAGRNRADVQVLADEAKAALGGYYREFLTPQRGKNPGDVWSLPAQPFPGAHFATMPPELARRCILAGCPEGGTVLDPFAGSGTTLKVARSLGRKSVGIELNPDYIDIIRERIGDPTLDFGTAS